MQFNFSKRQWSTLVIIGLADFFSAICISLQAPFFPQAAEKKGATSTEYGFVFGIFELVVFLVSPVFGRYLDRIGLKVVFNGGIFTTGGAAALFGLMDRVPGRGAFVGLAFTVRIVEALGNAAFMTSSFAIIAKEFPDSVATTFATLETCFGLGLVVGPMVGGFLYSIDGFYLPFVTMGSALIVIGVITLCILPQHSSADTVSSRKPSLWSILQTPGILLAALAIAATSGSIEFLGATLEPHLRQFKLRPVFLGMVFVINGAMYAVMAPVWGRMVDKCLKPKVATLIGSLLIILAFLFIGPAPFIPIGTTLSVTIVGLVVHGLGMGAVLVSTFVDSLNTAITSGMGDSVQTYGVISGLWTSSFAFGAFLGPSVSGALNDSVGFRSSTIFILVWHILVSAMIATFLIYEKKSTPDLAVQEVPEDQQQLLSEQTTPDVKNITGRTLFRRAMSDEVCYRRLSSISSENMKSLKSEETNSAAKNESQISYGSI